MIEMYYDREANAVGIELRPGAKSARMVKVSPTVNVDLDSKGRAISVEILNANWHLDERTLAALPNGEEWLTLKQAERESGLAAGTLRVLLNNGRLQGDKRGRDWFVEATALFNYMESREARGRPATNPRARRPTLAARNARP